VKDLGPHAPPTPRATSKGTERRSRMTAVGGRGAGNKPRTPQDWPHPMPWPCATTTCCHRGEQPQRPSPTPQAAGNSSTDRMTWIWARRPRIQAPNDGPRCRCEQPHALQGRQVAPLDPRWGMLDLAHHAAEPVGATSGEPRQRQMEGGGGRQGVQSRGEGKRLSNALSLPSMQPVRLPAACSGDGEVRSWA
jgi:hypothetical protein